MKVIQEAADKLVLEGKTLFGLLGSTQYIFDRGAGSLEISSKGLFGSKRREYPLAEITGATVQQESYARNPRPGEATYRIELVRRDGTRLPLTTLYTSGKAGKDMIAAKIHVFLAAAAPVR